MSESELQLNAKQAAELAAALSDRVAEHISKLALVSAGVMERQAVGPRAPELTGAVVGRVLGDGGHRVAFCQQEIGRVCGLDASGFEAVSKTLSKDGKIRAAHIQVSGYMDGGSPVSAAFNSCGHAEGNVLYGVATTDSLAARLATVQVAANIVDLTVRGCVGPSEDATDLREQIHAGAGLLMECAQLAPSIPVDFLGQRVDLRTIADQPFLDCVAKA